MNLIFTSHDLMCGCLKPLEHLQGIIDEQKCPTTAKITTKPTEENHGDDFNLDAGDLERLFENDDEETG